MLGHRIDWNITPCFWSRGAGSQVQIEQTWRRHQKFSQGMAAERLLVGSVCETV